MRTIWATTWDFAFPFCDPKWDVFLLGVMGLNLSKCLLYFGNHRLCEIGRLTLVAPIRPVSARTPGQRPASSPQPPNLVAGDSPLAAVRVFLAFNPPVVTPPFLDRVLALAENLGKFAGGVPFLLKSLPEHNLVNLGHDSLQGSKPVGDGLE
jgi:hypothetical protein